MLIRCPNKIL